MGAQTFGRPTNLHEAPGGWRAVVFCFLSLQNHERRAAPMVLGVVHGGEYSVPQTLFFFLFGIADTHFCVSILIYVIKPGVGINSRKG